MAGVTVFGTEIPEGRSDVGRAAGGEATAMFVYDVEPGASSCPYHYEYEEEWLLVPDGSVHYGLNRKGGYSSVTRTSAYPTTRFPQRSTPTTKSNRPRG